LPPLPLLVKGNGGGCPSCLPSSGVPATYWTLFFQPGLNFPVDHMKFSARVTLTGLKLQPELKLILGFDFCHVIACCVIIGFYP
jgi:hypothetical protein